MFRFSDGFDTYSSSADMYLKWDEISDDWKWNAFAGITGQGAFYADGVFGYGGAFSKGYRSFSFATTVTNVSFWVKMSEPPTNGTNIAIALSLVRCYTNSWPYINILGGGIAIGTTVGVPGVIYPLGTASYTWGSPTSTQVCDNKWHHIEYTVSKPTGAVAGTMTVYVDGVLILNAVATGDDSDAEYCGTNFVSVAYSCHPAQTLVDDVVIWDNEGTGMTTFPMGMRTIETLRPDAAGSSTQWSSVGGANYATVNEVNYDALNYVTTGNANNKDLYSFKNPATPLTTVTAAVVSALTRQSGTVPRGIRMRAKSSSSEAAGAAAALTNTVVLKQHAFTVDPATGTAWTASGLNAAEFGVELAY